MIKFQLVALLLAALLLTCRQPTKSSQAPGQPAWTQAFGQQLALMGHRNWIVIADAAYPLQNAPGILTLDTDSDQTAVLTVINSLSIQHLCQ